MADILILGGGFGGLITAERLAKSLGGVSRHRITLVSPRREFTFYPALVRLAFGDCQPEEITFDLVEKLNALNVRFVQGEAVRLNTKLKRVRVAGKDFDGDISFDYLIIAFGRRLATEKIGGFFEHAHHLLGVKAAVQFGEAVRAFKKGRIVVGLSPEASLPVPICETAFALAKMFAPEIADEKISVSVVFPETVRAAFGGADLHRKLEHAFARHHVNVTTDFPVREATAKAIASDNNRKIEFDLLMLVPPFRGTSLSGADSFINEFGFVETDNFLRVVNLEKVYAVGDIAAFPAPKLAFMAIRQAQVAAENIHAELQGKLPRKIYDHDLAVIIDEAGTNGIFLHYGIWDETLRGLKEGAMWSRMKKTRNYLWEMAHDS